MEGMQNHRNLLPPDKLIEFDGTKSNKSLDDNCFLYCRSAILSCMYHQFISHHICFFSVLVARGLSAPNEHRDESLVKTAGKQIFGCLHGTKKVTPTDNVLQHLMTPEIIAEVKSVRENFDFHLRFLKNPKLTNKMVGRHLMYLFQTELLPGISGKLVESKKRKENGSSVAVGKIWKIVGWAVIVAVNLGMLFYTYLFALTQSDNNQ
jgi:hypothetical protein